MGSSTLAALADSTARSMPAPTGGGTTMLSVHDAVGAFLYASPETKTVLGIDPDDLVGQAAAENIPPADMATIGEAYEAAFTTMQPVRLRTRSPGPQGNIWLESVFQAVQDNSAVRLVALTRRVDAPADHRASWQLIS